MKGNLHTPILIKVAPQPRSQGSLLPAPIGAGRREPWERGWVAPVNHGLQCTMVDLFVAESLVLFTFIEIMETICEKAIT